MKRPLCMVCCMLILCVMTIVWMFPPHIEDGLSYDGEEIILTGKVVKKEQRIADNIKTTVIYLKSVEIADIYYQELPVQEVNSAEKENFIKGIVCYFKQGEGECRLGATVTVKGTFQALQRAGNPGEFDSALYYNTMGYSGRLFQAEVLAAGEKYCPMQEMLYRLRRKLECSIDKAYEAGDAELLKAILLGNKSGVDSELKELYQKSGIIHILAISGLHISVLGMGLYGLLRKLTVPVTPAALISFGFLLLYGMMVGNSISVLRAVGMFGIKSLGRIWRRTYDLPTSLALPALLLLLEQPLYLYHSGYWLSFGSVAGIAVIYPVLQKLFVADATSRTATSRTVPEQRKKDWLLCDKSGKRSQKVTQAFLASVSVTIMTLPVTLWFYYEIPVYSVFLNLLVIPLMTVVMVLGVGNLILSVLFIPSKCISGIHHLIFELFEGLCTFSRRLPGNTALIGRPELLQVFLFYVCLAGTLILLKRCMTQKENSGKQRKRYTAAFLLSVSAVFILFFRKNSGFSVHMLDTGQGDTGVILYEDAAFIIDAGSSSQSNIGKDILIPFLKYHGISKVEAVFVTHPDADHYSGILELMEEGEEEGLRINRLILPRIASEEAADNPAMQKLEQTAGARGIPVLYFAKGMQLEKGGMTMICVHPDETDYGADSNAYSQVLLIKYHLFSMAFMGDVEGEAEQAALEAMEELGGTAANGVTVLKVAHHGSRYATGTDMLEQLRPTAAVISCGRNNRYGHPHEETIERLLRYGVRVLQTPESGAVTIRIDGKQMRIEEFRYGTDK